MRRLKRICLTLAALATVGCGGAAREERPAAGAAVMPLVAASEAKAPVAEAGVPKETDASDELAKSFRSMAAAKSFRALMTTTGAEEGKVETRTEAALPDRFYVFNQQFELIIVGQEVYRRFPGGRWEKSPTGMAITSLTDPKKLEDYLRTTRVRLIGSELLDGVQARVYQAAATHAPARKSVHDDPDPFYMKIWVGSSDGLPRKLEGTVLSTQTKTAVVFYDYNAKIAVKKPTN